MRIAELQVPMKQCVSKNKIDSLEEQHQRLSHACTCRNNHEHSSTGPKRRQADWQQELRKKEEGQDKTREECKGGRGREEWEEEYSEQFGSNKCFLWLDHLTHSFPGLKETPF